jgi:phage gpG-like protein
MLKHHISKMQETLEFVKLLDRVTKAVNVLPQRAATLAVNFSKERFRSQNWVDHTTEPWTKRKTRDKRKGRAILVDSGRLKNSIRKVVVTNDYAIIGTDVPYAKIHNDGFRGTENVRHHRRNGHSVRAHTRRVNMPRRRFIGSSAVLDRQLQRMMTAEITRAIKGTNF